MGFKDIIYDLTEFKCHQTIRLLRFKIPNVPMNIHTCNFIQGNSQFNFVFVQQWCISLNLHLFLLFTKVIHSESIPSSSKMSICKDNIA